MKRGKTAGGFTLVELLVVIAIISMLAGQLLPALSSAREKGREADTINNLHQFALAIEMYYQDYGDYSPWLSTLYPSYMQAEEIYVCKSDLNKGTWGHGNRDEATGAPKYPEANDISLANLAGNLGYPSGGDPVDPGLLQRNTDLEVCSYLYEFNPCRCLWFEAAHDETDINRADTDNDGQVNWKEAKIFQARHEDRGGQVPIIRVFWHYYNHGGQVLNLAFRDYNVYSSGLEWESTSYY